jgi:hypothetical protein
MAAVVAPTPFTEAEMYPGPGGMTPAEQSNKASTLCMFYSHEISQLRLNAAAYTADEVTSRVRDKQRLIDEAQDVMYRANNAGACRPTGTARVNVPEPKDTSKLELPSLLKLGDNFDVWADEFEKLWAFNHTTDTGRKATLLMQRLTAPEKENLVSLYKNTPAFWLDHTLVLAALRTRHEQANKVPRALEIMQQVRMYGTQADSYSKAFVVAAATAGQDVNSKTNLELYSRGLNKYALEKSNLRSEIQLMVADLRLTTHADLHTRVDLLMQYEHGLEYEKKHWPHDEWTDNISLAKVAYKAVKVPVVIPGVPKSEPKTSEQWQTVKGKGQGKRTWTGKEQQKSSQQSQGKTQFSNKKQKQRGRHSENSGAVICYNCGKPGHMSNNCRSTKHVDGHAVTPKSSPGGTSNGGKPRYGPGGLKPGSHGPGGQKSNGGPKVNGVSFEDTVPVPVTPTYADVVNAVEITAVVTAVKALSLEKVEEVTTSDQGRGIVFTPGSVGDVCNKKYLQQEEDAAALLDDLVGRGAEPELIEFIMDLKIVDDPVKQKGKQTKK